MASRESSESKPAGVLHVVRIRSDQDATIDPLTTVKNLNADGMVLNAEKQCAQSLEQQLRDVVEKAQSLAKLVENERKQHGTQVRRLQAQLNESKDEQIDQLSALARIANALIALDQTKIDGRNTKEELQAAIHTIRRGMELMDMVNQENVMEQANAE
jgi:hypothetical protein